MSGNSDAYYEELAEAARSGKNLPKNTKLSSQLQAQIKELQSQLKVLEKKCSQGEK